MIFIRMYSLDWCIKREINVFMYIDQLCNIENGTTNIYIYIYIYKKLPYVESNNTCNNCKTWTNTLE